jgi:hypothetical protein
VTLTAFSYVYNQRKEMFKEAQATPSPSSIGFIRDVCGSSARFVCKIWLQKQKLSYVFRGGVGCSEFCRFRNGGIYSTYI